MTHCTVAEHNASEGNLILEPRPGLKAANPLNVFVACC